MPTRVRSTVDEFLAKKRIAMVGVSRSGSAFSRKLFDEFRRRGYEVVPVNPNADRIDGEPCYATLKDIQPPVDAALLITTREATYRILVDCQEAGIGLVWLYGINGPRDVSASALEFCAANGIEVIPGYCPFMLFPHTGFIHRIHGAVLRMLGTYPGG